MCRGPIILHSARFHHTILLVPHFWFAIPLDSETLAGMLHTRTLQCSVHLNLRCEIVRLLTLYICGKQKEDDLNAISTN